MPYITTEEVREKRQKIKKALPKYKVSIRKEHHSSIRVNILSGPIQLLSEDRLDRGEEGVNHFYYKEHYAEEPEKLKVISTIIDILKDNQRIVSVDGDYGNIPNFYISLTIGQWDKGYEVIK